MQQRKVAFIGAGNMSRAIISGMVNSGYPSNMITASNPSRGKLESLQQAYAINITQDNTEAVAKADVIVLAVKPQLMEEVCRHLQQGELKNKLFVSIAAGIEHKRLLEMLGGDYALIRTMPNTPSSIGQGMTGLYAPKSVDANDKEFAQDILNQIGKTLWVEDEDHINTVIAAAGSSPAYFFLFLEAMQKETQAMGLDEKSARQLVQQAIKGSADLVCANEAIPLSELRAQVTSKGGTTAAAIETFQQQNLEQTVSSAMQAAVNRAEQMSKEF